MSKWEDEELEEQELEQLNEAREQTLGNIILLVIIPYIVYRFMTGTI